MVSFSDKITDILICALVVQRVVADIWKAVEHQAKCVGQCEGLTQRSSYFIEREYVISNHHARCQGKGPLERAELLGIEANIIEPPGVDFIEPL